MKKIILIFLIFPFSLSALEVGFEYATFKKENNLSLEFYLSINGAELVSLNNQTQLFVNLRLSSDTLLMDRAFILRGADDNIFHYVQTVSKLTEKEYTIHAFFYDNNNPKDTLKISQKVINPFLDINSAISTIRLLSKIEKIEEDNSLKRNGYFLEPIYKNTYQEYNQQLNYYLEFYDKEKSRLVLVRTKLFQNDNLIAVNNNKLETSSITPILNTISIKKLESGRYKLEIEIRSKDNERLAEQSVFFIRKQSVRKYKLFDIDLETDQSFVENIEKEELRMAYSAIMVLERPSNKSTFFTHEFKDKYEKYKKAILSYFLVEDSGNPQGAYLSFMKHVTYLHSVFFSAYGYGFETDRGKIYLRYGKPSEIVRVEDDPSAPPYEIWKYDEIERLKERNVKFIFYNPNLVPNDMQLLHSTSKNYRNNPNWLAELYANDKGEFQGNDIEVTGRPSSVHSHADEYFED